MGFLTVKCIQEVCLIQCGNSPVNAEGKSSDENIIAFIRKSIIFVSQLIRCNNKLYSNNNQIFFDFFLIKFLGPCV